MCDKTEADINETFSASKGWFERFIARVGLHNVLINGEASSNQEFQLGRIDYT